MVLPLFSGRLASWMAAQIGSAGGDADQHALLVADLLAGGKGVLVGDGDDLIVDLGVQHVGHKAGTDALNLVRARSALAQHGGGSRLNGHDLDVGVLALQVLADTGDGAAGTDAGHEDVDLAVGVLPDLRAGGALCGHRGWPGLQTGRA